MQGGALAGDALEFCCGWDAYRSAPSAQELTLSLPDTEPPPEPWPVIWRALPAATTVGILPA